MYIYTVSSVFLLIFFFQCLVFNELLTLMIPNICWTLTVYDGIKPIRRHHPRAGVCWLTSMCETHQLICQLTSRWIITPRLCVCALVCTAFCIVKVVFKRTGLLIDKKKNTIHQQSVNTDPDHLKAIISIFKFASGRVLRGNTVFFFTLGLNYLIHLYLSALTDFCSSYEHLLPSGKTTFI